MEVRFLPRNFRVFDLIYYFTKASCQWVTTMIGAFAFSSLGIGMIKRCPSAVTSNVDKAGNGCYRSNSTSGTPASKLEPAFTGTARTLSRFAEK